MEVNSALYFHLMSNFLVDKSPEYIFNACLHTTALDSFLQEGSF